MRFITTTALAASVLALSAFPAAATPACDQNTERTIHNLESRVGPAGPAVHVVETVACG